METQVGIDADLLTEALRSSGLQTGRQVVEKGLSLIVTQNQQAEIRALRGKLHWEGNLDEMRSPRWSS
jgi:Arc/MetJ family transcription regulator